MKKPILTLLTTAFSMGVIGQCTFGNDADLGETSTNYSDYLLGTAIEVNTAFQLTHFGMIVGDAGDEVEVALYSDNEGAPGNLLVSGTATTVQGTNEIDVPDINLPAGTYYYMAVFAGNASVSNLNTPGSPVWYISHQHGSPLPDPMENYATYTGKEFAYYLISVPQNSISSYGSLLQANNTDADSYQWIDCDTESYINGETSSSFSPDVIGNYACIIEQDGCSGTSDCISVNYIGLSETEASAYRIAPNPTNGNVSIHILDPQEQVEVMLYDMNGRQLRSDAFENLSNIYLSYDLPSGFYILKLVSERICHSSELIIK